MTPVDALLARLLARDRRWSAGIAALTRRHALLRLAAVIWSRSGDGWVDTLTAGLLLLFGSSQTRLFAAKLVAATLLTALGIAAIKMSVRRERPHTPEAWRRRPLARFDLYSFPSGHAARATCVALAVALSFPSLGVYMALWALGVYWARVAIGVHFVVDILGGVAVGAVLTGLIWIFWPWAAF